MYANSSSALIAMARLTVGQIHYLQGLYYSIIPGGESSSLEKNTAFFNAIPFDMYQRGTVYLLTIFPTQRNMVCSIDYLIMLLAFRNFFFVRS